MTGWLSQWQGHLLSCCGQLKITTTFFSQNCPIQPENWSGWGVGVQKNVGEGVQNIWSIAISFSHGRATHAHIRPLSQGPWHASITFLILDFFGNIFCFQNLFCCAVQFKQAQFDFTQWFIFLHSSWCNNQHDDAIILLFGQIASNSPPFLFSTFYFVFHFVSIFSCPEQLDRWPCHSLTYKEHTKSNPRDLWPLKHLIRVMK